MPLCPCGEKLNITINKARPEDREILGNLLELYIYEFTSMEDTDVEDDGRYGFDRLDSYFEEATRHPFLLRIGGKLAGFVLVRRDDAPLDGGEPVMDVAEFFVMQKYRRHGAGELMARQMFDEYPARWQVRELAANDRAHAFWRAIIGRYTNGQYEEHAWNDDRWRGPVQYFDNSRVI